MRMRVVLAAAVWMVAGGAAWAEDAPVPAMPKIPEKAFAITDDGAVGDGTTLNTAAIQKTLDACAKAGGGTVTVPKGNFVTSTLHIGSNTELHLEAGAVLALPSKHEDIAMKGGRYASLLFASGAHDVSITGEGTIEGNGGTWYKQYARGVKPAAGAPVLPRRPVLVSFMGCSRVLVKDVHIANSPSIGISFSGMELTVDHAQFAAPEDSPNTDGMDITGRVILISHTTLDVGEDSIAIRPTGDATAGGANCQDITIADCAFLRGKGISVGGTTLGGLKNLTVRNCTFDGTQNGIRLRASRTTGGTVENLTFDHLTMKDVKIPLIIASYFPTIPTAAAVEPAQPMTNATPIWKGIHFSEITADATLNAGTVLGLAEQPVMDVTFLNVHITAPKGMEMVHAKGVTFENSTITAEKGPGLIATDAETTGFDASKKTAIPASKDDLP